MQTTFSLEDRQRLAALIGVGEPFLSQCIKKFRNMKAADAMDAEIVTKGELKRWHLTQEWHLIWPDLVGTEGAPPPPEDKPLVPSLKRGKNDRAVAAEATRIFYGATERPHQPGGDKPNRTREGR